MHQPCLFWLLKAKHLVSFMGWCIDELLWLRLAYFCFKKTIFVNEFEVELLL